jgi:hypothetical protein
VLLGIVAAVLIPESILRMFLILYLTPIQQIETLISSFFQLFAYLALVVCISQAYLEKNVSLKDSYSRGLKRFWSAFGSNFLVGLAIGAPLILFVICALTAGNLSILLVLLWVPFAMYLSTKWSLSVAAITVEDIGASEGLKRSWNLTEGHFWRVFGTSFAAGLLTMLLTSLPLFFFTYLFTMANLSSQLTQALSLLVEQVAMLIALPFSVAVTVLIYYDLRIRKEGFDLQVLAESSSAPVVSAE